MSALLINKSTFLHLRIPFSYYLMPIFLFAVSQVPHIHIGDTILTFIALHLFLYPATNGYNSYYDRDEKSIGGLKHPPQVTDNLYYISLLFDAIAILLGLWVSLSLAIMILVYGAISKAYSHPRTRLKQYPWTGWFIACLFQGAFTYGMVYTNIQPGGIVFEPLHKLMYPAALSTLMLAGFYPVTQVYQHEEDRERGDYTISLLLGIRGTFYWAMACYFIAGIGFLIYFYIQSSISRFWLFLLFILPLLAYFFNWFRLVIKKEENANYTRTMHFNTIASTCLNGFFSFLVILDHINL